VEGVDLYTPADSGALMTGFVVRGMSPDAVTVRLEEDWGILCRPGAALRANGSPSSRYASGGRSSPGAGVRKQCRADASNSPSRPNHRNIRSEGV